VPSFGFPHGSASLSCPPSCSSVSTLRSPSCGGVLRSTCLPSYRFHSDASSEPILVHRLVSSCSDKADAQQPCLGL